MNRFIPVLLLLILLISCASETTTEVVTTPIPTSTRRAVAPSSTLTLQATSPPLATIAPPATVTIQPTDTVLPATSEPTATATVTPLPEVVVGIPAGRNLPVPQNTTWPYRVIVTESPAEALANGTVQLALVKGEEGIPAGTTPLAVTLPFTIFWDALSLTEAQTIQTNGHSFIEIVDWTDVRAHQKVMRVDGYLPVDPGYPLQQPWSLLAADGFAEAGAELGLMWSNVPAGDELIQLSAAGDIMLDRTLGNYIADGNLAYPFAHVAPIFQSADIAVGNLECALGDVGVPVDKAYPFRAPPAAAQSLAEAGFDVMSLANNHALDYGSDALLQGINLLNEQGVAPVGAGANDAEAHAPVFREVNGISIAFLAYVNVPVEGRSPFFDTQTWSATPNMPGLAWGEVSRMQEDIIAIREQVDHVVVILHSGYEYVPEPSPPQIELSYGAIDAGASLVIGHHTHILQGVEFYRDGVIVFGLGNFAFTIDGAPETAILQVWLDKTHVRQIQFIPAIIQIGGQPRLAEPWEAEPILQQVYSLSAILNPR